MERKGLKPSDRFSVISKQKEYNPETKKCYLCLKEKLEIMKVIENPNNINKKSELMGYCLHRYKSLLSNINLNGFVPNNDFEWFYTGQRPTLSTNNVAVDQIQQSGSKSIQHFGGNTTIQDTNINLSLNITHNNDVELRQSQDLKGRGGLRSGKVWI